MKKERHIAYGREKDGKIIYECDICGIVYIEDFETGEQEKLYSEYSHCGIYCNENWVDGLMDLEVLKDKLGIC